MHEAKVSQAQISELGMFLQEHFDEIELSQLFHSLKAQGKMRQFNAYMALLNKYDSFPKELIPFELDLHDYVLADKIMERVKL